MDGGGVARSPELWPALPIAEWQATRDTLHMWMQIVGKIRLALSPPLNHWWHVPLYVTARGLSTSPIPYQSGIFEMEFDFLKHQLVIETSAGAARSIPLTPRCVADFYAELIAGLRVLGVVVEIRTTPSEVADPVPFERDRIHSSYDPEYAARFWRVLVSADAVLKEFRAEFLGKSSPVHFFWGTFDLAVTRFSGRRAPERPGADAIIREAYSHEVISAGFWPGTGDVDAAFYSYAAPEPPGFSSVALPPGTGYYSTQFSEFLLNYEDMRKAPSPRETLLRFLRCTYEAGATLAGWDRDAVERAPRRI